MPLTVTPPLHSWPSVGLARSSPSGALSRPTAEPHAPLPCVRNLTAFLPLPRLCLELSSPRSCPTPRSCPPCARCERKSRCMQAYTPGRARDRLQQSPARCESCRRMITLPSVNRRICRVCQR